MSRSKRKSQTPSTSQHKITKFQLIGRHLFYFLILQVIYLVVASCSWKPVKQFQISEHMTDSPDRRSENSSCGDSQYYIPWKGESAISPVRTIRINVHYMNSQDGRKNLSGNSAVKFALELIHLANQELAHNQPMRLPLHNKTPVINPLIQYELVNKEDGSPAIYEHFDDENWYLVKKGPYKNNYNRSVIDRFGIGLDSILNVFIQVAPPDSMMTADYGGLKTGVALRNGIRISGPLLTDSRVWSYSGMFNHEVGHILGLRHSWVRDQCDDTPVNPNCWNFTQNGSVCDSLVSNNIMDSNADQESLTPCQIGIMHRAFAEKRRRQRGFLKPDYCKKKDVQPVNIQDTVFWCREIDVVADIVIEKNSQLVISNRVSMPQGSRIYIHKGGQLVLRKNARLQNACGLEWEGVFSKNPVEEQVVIGNGQGIIEN